MQSLDKCFEEALSALKSIKRVNYTGGDPVYYLVYPPKEMLRVKAKLTKWLAKLSIENFKPVVFSVADAIEEIITKHPEYEMCLDGEKEELDNFSEINDTLKDILEEDSALLNRFKEVITNLQSDEVLVITDLEALHPYLHISAIEAELQGKIERPTIVLYPGKRVGRNSLRFLGIHPEMGNYRSTHIGGW